MDVDKDTSYFQLQDKEYGGSKPAPVAITLSTPYWQELDYDDTYVFGRGSTSFSITSSQEEGDTASWQAGGGMNFSAEAMVGVSIGNQYSSTYHRTTLDNYNQLAKKYESEGVVPLDANAIMPHLLAIPQPTR
ncbi:MAG TPA: hypothetical protein DEB31_04910 [Clostridiales bacterium]|nr:hypothetical protein [Clostridiales bacterium]